MTQFTDLPTAEFAFPGPLRDRLVESILQGTKTSTTSTLIEYEIENEELPEVGDRSVAIDSSGKGVGVIEVTQVRIERLADVDLAHAVDEGEGFASVSEWCRDHLSFWESSEMRAAMGDPGFTVSSDSKLVLTRFELIARL
jgi:uncharacterized protein YhfF